jgi:bacterioferritin-associated ferredoxin
MIVCLCHGVSSGRIRALIGAGADTPRKIAAACRAGTDCGSCVGTIRAMVVDACEGAPCEVAFAPRAASPYVVAGEHA